MKKKLLVLGASGLTGYKAIQIGKSRFETYGTFNARSSSDKSLIKLDIAKEAELTKLFTDIRPDLVINATALHNVDYCETHSEEAYSINSKAVARMAALCNQVGARLIHISTDFVFGGEKGNYLETDSPNPLSIYGKSKLEGEMMAKQCNSYTILRPSVVYGWTPIETQGSISSSGKPMNFALWALSQMKSGDELKIVNDQFTSPTLADVLAAVAIRCGAREENELYHVAGTSSMSRFEFTRKLAIMMGYSMDKIVPVESKSFSQAARRPMNSTLHCDKVQKMLNYRLLTTDESLAIMRSQIEIESPFLLGNAN